MTSPHPLAGAVRVGAGRRLPARPVLATLVAGAVAAGSVTAPAAAVTAPAASVPTASAPESASAGAPPALAPPGPPLCRMADARVDEASGLTVTGGLMWTHDDSGEGVARVLGLDAACRTVAVLALVGHDVLDAEDLAGRTGADGRSVLWLADTGDNLARRERVALLRLPVPAVEMGPASAADAPVLPAEAATFPLVYADGPRDAEALLVDAAGAPALVSKPLVGRPGLYLPSAPLAPGEVTVLRRAGDVHLGRSAADPTTRAAGPAGPLSSSLVTGGAVSVDGGGVALTTYTDVHVWRAGPSQRTPAGGLDLGALLGRPPDAVLALPGLEQAEAVAWTEDGRGLLVTSEGRSAPVHLMPLPRPPVQADGVPPPPAAVDGRDAAPTGQAPAPAPVAGAGRSGASDVEAGPGLDLPTARQGEQPELPLRSAVALLALLALAGSSFWAVRRRRRSARLARSPRG